MLAPDIHEHLVRLSSRLPFEQAVEELYFSHHCHVSEPTARRLTQAAGEAWVELETEEARRIQRELSSSPEGPLLQQFSVDGAMVPLVGGEWSEVKTLVIGALTGQELGEAVKAQDLSYFSRLTDSESFTDLALVEVHRRGVDTAGVVVAINDGAAWEQGFVDAHRVDAVRVLDFGHAAEYLTRAAQAVYGAASQKCTNWLTRWQHELRHGDSQLVLDELIRLQDLASLEAADIVSTSVKYLSERREQIRYSEMELMGIPIGSGIVESGNKLVVEQRLKGSGMHWARRNVNPMLALRNVLCSQRWEGVWSFIIKRLRQQQAEATSARRARREAVEQPIQAVSEIVLNPAKAEPPAKPQTTGRTKPAANHPWRRYRNSCSLLPAAIS
jgi:hypothetical protein